MAQDNISIIRGLYDSINRRDFDGYRNLFGPDCKQADIPNDRVYRGPDGMVQYLRHWLDAFPDGKVDVRNCFAQGDWVCAEILGRGTHQAEMEGPGGTRIPATNRSLELPIVDIYQVRNGKIVEVRTYYDLNTVSGQLGLSR